MPTAAEVKTEDSSDQPDSSRFSIERLAVALPDAGSHIIFWLLTIGGMLLDLWTKKAAFARLEPGEVLPVIDGFFQLVRAENNGAAFGLFAGKAYFLTTISAVAMLVIFGVFLFGGNKQKLVNIALGLFAAGVCGNLYDRAFNGGLVRDFIDVYYRDYHWHTFNVADALLCIGVGLLIISSFSTEQPAQKHDPPQK
ncbi:MAG: signal peptidase II [Planctomycetota bacterium]|nr:MAG: signal peptidase II [Planctomycetota bacterium]